MENHSEEVLSALQQRYATKRFDLSYCIPGTLLHTLRESIRLAPSALGLQLWKVLEIRDPELRKKILITAHNQPQMTEASDLFLFCRPDQITEASIEHFVDTVAEARQQPKASLVAYRQMLNGFIKNVGSQNQIFWMEKQIYIALGMLLETAALLGLDACPLEGFDREAVDEILQLPGKHLRSVVFCALGKRSPEDSYASAAKVRYPETEMFEAL